MPNFDFNGIDFNKLIETSPERPPGIGEGVEPIEFFDKPEAVPSENSEAYNQNLGGSVGVQAPPTPLRQYASQSYLPQSISSQGGNLSPPIQATEISLNQIDLQGALLACEQAGFSGRRRRKAKRQNAGQSNDPCYCKGTGLF